MPWVHFKVTIILFGHNFKLSPHRLYFHEHLIINPLYTGKSKMDTFAKREDAENKLQGLKCILIPS